MHGTETEVATAMDLDLDTVGDAGMRPVEALERR